MDLKEKFALERLRERIDLGEVLTPILIARYYDLVGQEARSVST